jgi:hypothetical protein
MKRRIDQLVVSDEEIAEAAVNFIKFDGERRARRAERNALLEETTCWRSGVKEGISNCLDAIKAGEIEEDSDEVCENCKEIEVRSKLVRKANAQRNGKLRRLRTLVNRRTGTNAEDLELQNR